MKTLNKHQIGATMVEYAFMLSLIAFVAAIGAAAIGLQTSTRFECIEEKIKDLDYNCDE